MKYCALALVALLVAVFAVDASAQPPVGTAICVSSFSTPGNKIVFLDRTGSVSSVLGSAPLVGGGSTDSIEMGPFNNEILIFDTTGVHRYNKVTGVSTFVVLAGANMNWGCIGEENEVYAAGSGGTVMKYDNLSGSGSTLFAKPHSLLFNAMCWDGTTGGVIGGIFSSTTTSVQFIAPDGIVTKTVGGITSVSGIDWSPWDGSAIVSRFGNSTPSLVRVDRLGTVTSLGSGGTIVATQNSAEVRENPVEEYLGVEFGGAPRHVNVTTPGGVTTALHTDTGSAYGPSDACYYEDRAIWGTGSWRIGQPAKISVNFGGSNGNDFYQVALSFSHNPGIDLPPAGRVHLTPDALFFFSLFVGAPLFNNFTGQLNSNGVPTNTPFVNVPPIAGLIGLRVHAAVIAFNQGGVQGISNCWGVNIKK